MLVVESQLTRSQLTLLVILECKLSVSMIICEPNAKMYRLKVKQPRYKFTSSMLDDVMRMVLFPHPHFVLFLSFFDNEISQLD